jgi:general transcriptional corepressor TUP1
MLTKAIMGIDLRKECRELPAYRKRQHITDNWLAAFNDSTPPCLDIDLVFTFTHTSVVCCVAFSKNGRFLATGCSREASIFDTASGSVIYCFDVLEFARFTGDEPYCRSVSFSPDGKYLATGWEDETVRILDLESKTLKTTCRGHEKEIYCIYFAEQGETLASCSVDRSLRLWNIYSGDCTLVLSADDGFTSVAISPDGKYLAAGSLDERSMLYDISSGELLATLDGHADSVYSIRFSPDSTKILTASLDKTVKRWDISAVLQAPKGKNTYSDSLIGHVVSIYVIYQLF